MKIIRIEKFEHHRPVIVTELIAWLQEKLEAIPEEYRDGAELDIDYDRRTDSIVYWREETPEDVAKDDRRVRRGWFYKLQADIERIRKTSNL